MRTPTRHSSHTMSDVSFNTEGEDVASLFMAKLSDEHTTILVHDSLKSLKNTDPSSFTWGVRTYAPLHAVMRVLEAQEGPPPTVSNAFINRAATISVIHNWFEKPTLSSVTKVAGPRITPRTTLGKHLAIDLGPGTTFLPASFTHGDQKVEGLFVTPDVTANFQFRLIIQPLTEEAGKPVILPLDVTVEQATLSALQHYSNQRRTPRHVVRQLQLFVRRTINLLQAHLDSVPKHPDSRELQDDDLNIYRIAHKVTNWMTHVQYEHERLGTHITDMRNGVHSIDAAWASHIFIPTSALEELLDVKHKGKPLHKESLNSAHLISSILALDSSGQVSVFHQPLSQLPTILTWNDLLDVRLARNLPAPALYFAARQHHNAPPIGMILRADYDGDRHSLLLTYHMEGNPTLRIKLGVTLRASIVEAHAQLRGLFAPDLQNLSPLVLDEHLLYTLSAIRQITLLDGLRVRERSGKRAQVNTAPLIPA